MKRALWILGFAVCAAAVSACGGKSAPPIALESAARYQAQLNWPASGAGDIGGNTSFGITDMLVTIPFSGTQYSDMGLVTNQTSFGVGLAPPSPLPDVAPTETPQPADLLQIRNNPVTWTAIGTGLTIAAQPQWDATLGPTVDIGAGSAGGTTMLAATAVGPPVNVGVSVKVYAYRVADIGCVDGGALGGASFVADAQGGHFVAQTDPASSDLYVTGPGCSGAFVDPSGYTVHVPHGGSLINTDGVPMGEANNRFFTLAPSAWQEAFTQLSEAQFTPLFNPCAGAPPPPQNMCVTPENNVLIFKTSAGDVVKMYIATTYHATTSGRNVTGAFEVSSGGAFPF